MSHMRVSKSVEKAFQLAFLKCMSEYIRIRDGSNTAGQLLLTRRINNS